jgi:hypothetical protein
MKKANTDEAVVSERPNRSRYAERFSKSHPDIDFEDKEARYGAMNEDRDLLDSYEESGRALGETFDKHPWTGSMLMALKENDELDPITWMAENGIDIQQALEDEEYRKTISQKIADYEQKQLEGKKSDEERAANLQTSADALRELGLSDEENLKVWSHVWEDIIDPALRGEITADTWRLVQKAQNYDADIENARNEGAMKARNEKIQNSLKKPTNALPPDLASGARASAAPKPKKKKSFASSFFEGVE